MRRWRDTAPPREECVVHNGARWSLHVSAGPTVARAPESGWCCSGTQHPLLMQQHPSWVTPAIFTISCITRHGKRGTVECCKGGNTVGFNCRIIFEDKNGIIGLFVKKGRIIIMRTSCSVPAKSYGCKWLTDIYYTGFTHLNWRWNLLWHYMFSFAVGCHGTYALCLLQFVLNSVALAVDMWISATADHNPELQVCRSLDHMYSCKIILAVCSL